MSDDDSSVKRAKSRVTEMSEEVQTKGLYIALALLFVANSAGVFSEDVPSIIFVALFVVAVGIDAYN